MHQRLGHRWFWRGAVGMVLAVVPVLAAAAPQGEGFPLFESSNRDPRALITQDFDPSRPGKEILGFSWTTTLVSPTNPPPANLKDKIAVAWNYRVSARSADGATSVFVSNPGITVTSGFFPDPRVQRFQCGGANETSYRSSSDANFDMKVSDAVIDFSRKAESSSGELPGCSTTGENRSFTAETFLEDVAKDAEFPSAFRFGIGAANGGSARVVVMGAGLEGNYDNNVDGDETDIGGYTMSGFNPAGATRWTRVVPASTINGRLLSELCLVGDFLNDDGIDEIRLVYVKADAQTRVWTYLYYDVLTGRPTVTARVSRN